MTEPTREQIKEFWEWCDALYWQAGNVSGEPIGIPLYTLSLDLNNLFKYAVPKLQKDGLDVTLYLNCWSYPEVIIYRDRDSKEWHTSDEDPALALFWAIWEVIHGK